MRRGAALRWLPALLLAACAQQPPAPSPAPAPPPPPPLPPLTK